MCFEITRDLTSVQRESSDGERHREGLNALCMEHDDHGRGHQEDGSNDGVSEYTTKAETCYRIRARSFSSSSFI